MQSKATTPEQYLAELPEERQGPMRQLRQTILENLPEGFEEVMSYGMIGYVVPHSISRMATIAIPNCPCLS